MFHDGNNLCKHVSRVECKAKQCIERVEIEKYLIIYLAQHVNILNKIFLNELTKCNDLFVLIFMKNSALKN